MRLPLNSREAGLGLFAAGVTSRDGEQPPPSPDLELPPLITLTQVGQFLVSLHLSIIRDTLIQLANRAFHSLLSSTWQK